MLNHSVNFSCSNLGPAVSFFKTQTQRGVWVLAMNFIGLGLLACSPPPHEVAPKAEQDDSPRPTLAWKIEAPWLYPEPSSPSSNSLGQAIPLDAEEELSLIPFLHPFGFLQFQAPPEGLESTQLFIRTQCLLGHHQSREEQSFDLDLDLSNILFIYQILPLELLKPQNFFQSPAHCAFHFTALSPHGDQHHFLIPPLPVVREEGSKRVHIKLGREPLYFKKLSQRVVEETQFSQTWIKVEKGPLTQSLTLHCENFSTELSPPGPFHSRNLMEFDFHSPSILFSPPWQQPLTEAPYQNCRVFAQGKDRLLGLSELFEMRFSAPSLQMTSHLGSAPPPRFEPQSNTQARPFFAHEISNPHPIPLHLRIPKQIQEILVASYYSLQGDSHLKLDIPFAAQMRVRGPSAQRVQEFPHHWRVELPPQSRISLEYVSKLPYRSCSFTHPRKNTGAQFPTSQSGIQIQLVKGRLPWIEQVSSDWSPQGGKIFARHRPPAEAPVYNLSYDSRHQLLSEPEDLSEFREARAQCR